LDVVEARKRDPVGAEFARLWEGKWVSGMGGAVSESDIDGCFRLEKELDSPESGNLYVAGLDLGVSHDHAGVALLGVNEREQIIKTAAIRGWAPSIPNDKGVKEVDSEAVENTCLYLHQRFHIRWFGYDPAAGGSFMAQRLRKRGVPMREWTFGSPTNQTLMATALVTAMKGQKLVCYEDIEGRLRRDFGKFMIEHKPPNHYKLVSVSDEHGHADVGTALVICLPQAINMLRGWNVFGPEDTIYEDSGERFEQDEVDELPESLREIYEEEEQSRYR